jgi:hypothetical protein
MLYIFLWHKVDSVLFLFQPGLFNEDNIEQSGSQYTLNKQHEQGINFYHCKTCMFLFVFFYISITFPKLTYIA